jgi:hypothetical protein
MKVIIYFGLAVKVAWLALLGYLAYLAIVHPAEIGRFFGTIVRAFMSSL